MTICFSINFGVGGTLFFFPSKNELYYKLIPPVFSYLLIVWVSWTGRFRAFEIAHGMDSNSNGRGVRQFKTSLLQRLEQVRT